MVAGHSPGLWRIVAYQVWQPYHNVPIIHCLSGWWSLITTKIEFSAAFNRFLSIGIMNRDGLAAYPPELQFILFFHMNGSDARFCHHFVQAKSGQTSGRCAARFEADEKMPGLCGSLGFKTLGVVCFRVVLTGKQGYVWTLFLFQHDWHIYIVLIYQHDVVCSHFEKSTIWL